MSTATANDKKSPNRNPIGAFLAVAMLIALIAAPLVLFGRTYFGWLRADPAHVLPQLDTPPDAEVVHTFGPLPYAPTEDTPPVQGSQIVTTYGLVFRSSVPPEAIEAAYVAQFEANDWRVYTDRLGRAALPNGLEVMVQPYSAEALARHFDEQITLAEGERLYLVWAWQSTYLD